MEWARYNGLKHASRLAIHVASQSGRFPQNIYQLAQKQSSHMPVGTHHLPTGKTTKLFVFFFVPISHISQGLFSRSHPHLISYPGFVSALSWQHDRAQRCRGEKCQIKAKDLIWERPNAFHIRSQKIGSGAG